MRVNLQQLVLYYLVLSVLLTSTGSAALGAERGVAEYTRAVGDSDALAARDIALLAEAYDTLRTHAFYEHRLEQLADAGPEALPALEALLNRDIWPHRPDSTGQTIDSLRATATQIWYDIRWKKANERDRIATAVMSVNPHAEVGLAPDVGYKKVLELGAKARPAIYELLMSGAKYEPNTLNYRRVGCLAGGGVLEAKTFAPTGAEITSVLREGGEYGKFTMMCYLLYTGHYSDLWFTTFSDWMATKSVNQQDHLLAWLLDSAKRGHIPPGAMADKITKVALDAAERSVREVVQGNPQQVDYSILPQVAVLLFRYKDRKHLDRLKTLYEAFRRPLEQATPEEIITNDGRYGPLYWNARAAAKWIQKLEKQ